MIKNERQYRITKAQADGLSRTLDSLSSGGGGETGDVRLHLGEYADDFADTGLALPYLRVDLAYAGVVASVHLLYVNVAGSLVGIHDAYGVNEVLDGGRQHLDSFR